MCLSSCTDRPPVVIELDHSARPQHLVNQQEGQPVVVPLVRTVEVHEVEDWPLIWRQLEQLLQRVAASPVAPCTADSKAESQCG